MGKLFVVEFQEQHVLEDDIVDVEHDVPVIVADPSLEQDFVDVPHIPAVVHQANQYELTWCPSFRFVSFSYSKCFILILCNAMKFVFFYYFLNLFILSDCNAAVPKGICSKCRFVCP